MQNGKNAKKKIFVFFYFASNWPNFWDIFPTQGEANIKINVRATSGQNMGSVAPVVWELWPVDIEKGDFSTFFLFCMGLFKLKRLSRH